MLDLDRIQSILIHNCQLKPAKNIIAGVSGGPDSVCLFDVLVKLKWPVMVAHFDHHIRLESSEDARFVRCLAEQYGVPFLLGEAQAGRLISAPGLSLEAAARQARYRFLFDQARKHTAQAVLVAHTADDQVETMLLHLLRGSGLDGLCGMDYRNVLEQWDSDIPLVRPMLDVWRNQVEEYCSINQLQFVEDKTNQDISYLRNKVRRELIPRMEEINPQFKTGVQRLSTLIRDDVEELDGLCEKQWPDVFQQSGNGWISLLLPRMRQISPALQRRILRKAWSQLRGKLDDVEFETIERARCLIDRPTISKRIQLSNGLWAKLEGYQFFLFDDEANLPMDESYPSVEAGQKNEVPVPGRVELGNGWLIIAEVMENTPEKNWTCSSNYEAYLDAEQIQHTLCIRTGQQGERFAPLGMGGRTQKLSDFFINQKIPERQRENLPLITDQERIVWIPGFRSADFCRVTSVTRKIIHLQLLKMD